jgi:uncharacterized RmlC-like cupin family protein
VSDPTTTDPDQAPADQALADRAPADHRPADETPTDAGTQAWHRDLPGPDAGAGREHAERDHGGQPWRRPLHHVRAGTLDADTAQTKGMRRFEALSRTHGGTDKIWLGENHVGPEMKSGDHHHGEAETGIYVVSGHPEFVFLVDGSERRIETGPGDYVFVPPYVPHREENPHPEPAVVVLARSTQEGIVVNLPSLDAEVEIREVDQIPEVPATPEIPEIPEIPATRQPGHTPANGRAHR